MMREVAMNTILQDAPAARTPFQRIAIKTVLYASDFSSPSAAAFPYALAIARMYQAKLIIFHALPTAPFDPQRGFLITPDHLLKSAKAELKRLGRCAARVPHRLVLREGDVWSALDDFTNRQK